MSKLLHLCNYGNTPYKGWVRRGIDWLPEDEPGSSRALLSGMVQGRPFTLGRDLGAESTNSRAIDVKVNLDAGEQMTLDFDKVSDFTDEYKEEASALRWVAPTAITIAGVQLGLRSTSADGAALEAVWVGHLGELEVRLLLLHYPGQTWARGALQLTAKGPSRVATVPSGLVLGADGFEIRVADLEPGDEILPAGETIGAGQGFSTLPVLIWLVGTEPCDPMTLGAIGRDNVWPIGNPSWHPRRGPVMGWLANNYPRVMQRQRSWLADPLGINADAQRTGGEGDQVFVGAEMGRGMESAGTEIVNLLVAYGYARRPGKWTNHLGDSLVPGDHPDLCLFEGYPFTRGGSKDTLGLSQLPNRIDTHGWWNWREHWFFNRLFVAYLATGYRELQWQIEHLGKLYLLECTVDPRFSTSNYTGAVRGFSWESLMVWWLVQTLEDTKLVDEVQSRWLGRWNLFGARYKDQDFWDVRRDDRLGPGFQWLVYQQAAAAMLLDMAGWACNLFEARTAALRGARAVLKHGFLKTDKRWVGYSYVPMVDNQPVPLPEGAHFGSGIESWMVGAAVVVLRHDPTDTQAREILKQHVEENNVNGQWIAPDVLEMLK